MPSDLTNTLDRFLAGLPERVDALRRDAAEVDASLLPLDLSYESLDRVEDYYRRVVEGQNALGGRDEAHDRVATYLGATLIDRVGGKWAMYSEPPIPAEPAVVAVPHVAGASFRPIFVTRGYARHRAPGHLRDSTERWDLARRGETLRRQIDQLDSELEELRRDVSALTGCASDVLDGSAVSLSRVEDALKKLRDGVFSLDTVRRVRGRVVLLLGTCLRRALGEGEWSVVDDPRNADFGQFRIGHWAPYPIVSKVGPRSRPLKDPLIVRT